MPGTAATTAPSLRVLRSDEVTPVIASVVVVALVVVELTTDRLVMVEDAALTMTPPVKVRRLEVALLGNGYAKVSKPVSAEQMTEPCALVVSAEEPEQEAVFWMARLVVVAWASVVFPATDSAPLALRVPPTLSTPLTVEEPVTANEVEVAPASVVPWSDEAPSTVSAARVEFPKLTVPSALKLLEMVVEPVTARLVEVAPWRDVFPVTVRFPRVAPVAERLRSVVSPVLDTAKRVEVA